MIAPSSHAKGLLYAVVISERGGAERRQVFDTTELSIGRVQGNDLLLPKGNVSKRHARILYREGRFIVTDLNSTNGTYVNRRRIAQASIVREGDRIFIGDFILRIELLESPPEGSAGVSSGPVMTSGGSSPRLSVSESVPVAGDRMQSSPSISSAPTGTSPAHGSSPDAAGRTSSSQMRLIGRERSPEETTLSTTRETALTAGLIEQRRFLASAVERVTASLDPGALDGELDSRVFARVEQLVNQLDLPKLPEDLELAKVRDYVKTELLGHGPLGALLVDKSMLAVTISSYDQIFVTRRSGDRQLVAHGFSSDSALRRAVSRLCREAGRPLERGEEKVERRLTDGTRLSALLGPPGFTSSMLTLRRPRVRGSSLEDLVRQGTVSAGLSKLLSYCLRGRVNLLLVGGPGADLFGIASALCAACDDASLMVVEEYEDLVPAELPRAIRVNAAQLGPQGAPFLTHACKIQGARLIIDMANSGLVLSAFETISAGVDGVVATLSAASLSHGMWRLTAALAAGRPGLSVPAARAWITGSFELVLELVRLSDGRQRVQRALELVGVGEDDFLLQDIFTFVSPPGSDKGEFVAAGTVPRVVERLMAHGYPFDTSMFKQ